MTDKQAERLIAIQAAQLAMLQGILENAMVIAGPKGTLFNWNEMTHSIANAEAALKKMG
jgi:hypothetical protein